MKKLVAIVFAFMLGAACFAGENGKHEIIVKDIASKDLIGWSANAFDAGNLYLAFNQSFGLSNKMTDDEKVEFTRALCYSLDNRKTEYKVREIILNDFDGFNLRIDVHKVQLKDGAVKGADWGFLFVTNAVFTKDPESGEWKYTQTVLINKNRNFAILIVPLKKGRMALAININQGKYKYDKSLDFIDKVNLMDILIKDEDEKNDEQIPLIYKEIMESENVEPAFVKQAFAPLNYGLYLGKKRKLKEAEDLWNSIDVTPLESGTAADQLAAETLKRILATDAKDLLVIWNHYDEYKPFSHSGAFSN